MSALDGLFARTDLGSRVAASIEATLGNVDEQAAWYLTSLRAERDRLDGRKAASQSYSIDAAIAVYETIMARLCEVGMPFSQVPVSILFSSDETAVNYAPATKAREGRSNPWRSNPTSLTSNNVIFLPADVNTDRELAHALCHEMSHLMLPTATPRYRSALKAAHLGDVFALKEFAEGANIAHTLPFLKALGTAFPLAYDQGLELVDVAVSAILGEAPDVHVRTGNWQPYYHSSIGLGALLTGLRGLQAFDEVFADAATRPE